MAKDVIHISEAEAASDFAAQIARVRAGAEIVIEKKERQSGKYKKVCVTDPDATMATNARNRRLEPAYSKTVCPHPA